MSNSSAANSDAPLPFRRQGAGTTSIPPGYFLCTMCDVLILDEDWQLHTQTKKHSRKAGHCDYMCNPLRWIPMPHRLVTTINSDGWPRCELCSTSARDKFMVQEHWNSGPHRQRLEHFLTPELARTYRLPSAWLRIPDVRWEVPSSFEAPIPPPPPVGVDCYYYWQWNCLEARACCVLR
jgi:hypothetical protein